jgi:glycosyltransferase involved in cell wall biosynthesis
MSIALSCNVYQDATALRGLLELGSRYFDNIFILHTGPGGAKSTDGTIELCESFGISPIFDDIDKGFGVIRSRLIHDCGCDWAMLLDADERFYPQMNVLLCEGEESYPGHPNPALKVTTKADVIDQGAHVKNLIRNPDTMALRATRRHWFDFSMKKPTQNWMHNNDHQMRIVRNHPQIGYVKERVMHEWLRDFRTGKDPQYVAQDPMGGPFIDHYHMFYRRSQPGHKEHNEQNYSRLERGEKMVTR